MLILCNWSKWRIWPYSLIWPRRLQEARHTCVNDSANRSYVFRRPLHWSIELSFLLKVAEIFDFQTTELQWTVNELWWTLVSCWPVPFVRFIPRLSNTFNDTEDSCSSGNTISREDGVTWYFCARFCPFWWRLELSCPWCSSLLRWPHISRWFGPGSPVFSQVSCFNVILTYFD